MTLSDLLSQKMRIASIDSVMTFLYTKNLPPFFLGLYYRVLRTCFFFMWEHRNSSVATKDFRCGHRNY